MKEGDERAKLMRCLYQDADKKKERNEPRNNTKLHEEEASSFVLFHVI